MCRLGRQEQDALEAVTGVRCRSAVAAVAGHQSSRNSGGWQSTEVAVVADSKDHYDRAAGRNSQRAAVVLVAVPSMRCQASGEGRGCDGDER